ncbi:MAG: response regulator [Desulfobacterales bacterium]|nr:response regulator [Desulfobacterales bacterium]
MELLIIDDEPSITGVLVKQITRWGYGVRSAQNSREAIKIISTCRIDLILLDIYLEETTAIELIPEVKRIKPGIDIITMTGQSSRELEKEIRSLGIIYYMEKPIETANLKSILEHMESRLIKQ